MRVRIFPFSVGLVTTHGVRMKCYYGNELKLSAAFVTDTTRVIIARATARPT